MFSILNYVMKDPKYWDDPESFKPERFLDEDGQKLKREDRMVAFGIGKEILFSLLYFITSVSHYKLSEN